MVKTNRAQCVIRALNILDCFSEEEYLSFSEIGKKTNLSNGTVNRLLNTLISQDFIQKNSDTRFYSLSKKLFLLGFLAFKNFKFSQIIHPILEELTLKSNETSNASILYENALVFIDTVGGKHSVKMDVQIGKKNYIHTSASGKIIVAFLEEKESKDIINRVSLKKITDNTITNKELFIKEIKKAKLDGYAIDNEEEEIGLKCIAGPVFDIQGRVIGSISISGPALRIDENLETFKQEITYFCKKASLKLGYLDDGKKFSI
jgi:IclR family transcriptional regulator, KDG regulon repressor